MQPGKKDAGRWLKIGLRHAGKGCWSVVGNKAKDAGQWLEIGLRHAAKQRMLVGG